LVLRLKALISLMCLFCWYELLANCWLSCTVSRGLAGLGSGFLTTDEEAFSFFGCILIAVVGKGLCWGAFRLRSGVSRLR
jgi:hypothetical protein